jgi:hypothetical protein
VLVPVVGFATKNVSNVRVPQSTTVVPLTGVLKVVPLIVHGIWDALATVRESTVNANNAKNFFI